MVTQFQFMSIVVDGEGYGENDYKSLSPMAYEEGWNRGRKYYQECVPRERQSFRSRWTTELDKAAFSHGLMDGYDEAEQNDCTTNFINDNSL